MVYLYYVILMRNERNSIVYCYMGIVQGCCLGNKSLFCKGIYCVILFL